MSHLLLVFLALAVFGFAQERSSVAPAATDANSEIRLAPVVIDGETLFTVRGVTARPADRRAREIAERIRRLASNPQFTPSSLTLQEQADSTWILGGGERIMSVFDEDSAIEEIARGLLAELYRGRIGEAIETWRRDRQPRVLWLNALYALVATLALLALGYAGRGATTRLRAFLERRCREQLQAIEDRAFHLLKAEQIWRGLIGVMNVAVVAGIAFTVYFYLDYVLGLFPWTRAVANTLHSAAVEPLRSLGLGLVGFLPNFVFIALVILITRYALKLVRLFFDGVARSAITLTGFDPEWAWPTFRLIRLLGIALAVVVVYPYIPGSRSEAFKGVTLFMGIIFSLGSSSLIGNFIAGYSMTYRRAFRIGDRIRIGEHVGVVERMRLLVTHLRTIKNEELIVPNSAILATEVTNYTSLASAEGLILHTTVGIGYETPWRQVEAMLLEAAERTAGLLREPTPFVLQKCLGDYCITYEINVFCDAPNAMEALYSELHRRILDVFNEYGVQIMTPSYMADPAEAKIVPKHQWYLAPAQPPRPDNATLTLDSGGR
jgi:small-conductance mechanosensitive channel